MADEPDEPVLWDAPNQQVVRADQSAPWEEGTGGTVEETAPGGPPPSPVETGAAPDYEAMTKDELIALARERGISPANADMSKSQLIDALRAAD